MTPVSNSQRNAKAASTMATQQTISQCAKCPKTSEETTLKQCSRCHEKYCSQECQKADWKEHKKTCKAPGSNARPYESMLPGMRDDELTVPMNAEVPGEPGVVEFGPVTTVGELRNAQPGPKRRYEDRLYNATPEQIYKHCMEILEQHKKAEKNRSQAQGSKDKK